MARMGSYCKAYPVQRLRAYPAWRENAESARNESDYLYLQDNYVVTDGIFVDEHVIFDQVTDEWKTYCTDTLQFVPAR